MKKFYFIAACTVILFSCSKKDAQEQIGVVQNQPIAGYWQGTYNGSTEFGVLFRSNGTVRIYDAARGSNFSDTTYCIKSEGTYLHDAFSFSSYLSTSPTRAYATFRGKISTTSDGKGKITGTMSDAYEKPGEAPVLLIKYD